MKKLLILLIFASCSKSVGMSAAAQNADRLRKYYANELTTIPPVSLTYNQIVDSIRKYDSIYSSLTGQKATNIQYEDFNGNPY